MKRRKSSFFYCFVFLASLILLSCVSLPVSAQNKASKAVAKQEKMKIKKKKEELKAYKKLLKHHLKIQSKDTRKRMRHSKKKATMINENRRPSFIKRWFARKQKRK